MYDYNPKYEINDYKQNKHKTMKITIHRGTDQIGGSVTENEYEGFDHMTNTEVVPRIYLFTYHKL